MDLFLIYQPSPSISSKSSPVPELLARPTAIFPGPDRFQTLTLLVKDKVAGSNPVVAGTLLPLLKSCSLHPIVAYDRWDHISPEHHLKLLLGLWYFSHCVECRLALHFWHGVAFGEKWPKKNTHGAAFIWHPGADGKRSIWRIYADETQRLPEQEETGVRTALVHLARSVHVDVAVSRNGANGSTRHGQRISGTSDFLKRSLVIGATIMHEMAHAWWNANHGHREDERCFENYPEQEIGLAHEWFVHRGTFSVDLSGVLTITRLPSSGINEVYHRKTNQLSGRCRVTIPEMRRYVDSGDVFFIFDDASFWHDQVLVNPLAPRALMELQPS